MSELLFIRHAETDMAGTFCGHSDPALNSRGHAQVADLIDSLCKEEISAVYTSDLRRAHTTAMAIAKAFSVDCYVRSTLREINFGQWEGATWKEIEERDINYARRWLAEYPHLPAPGGEKFYDFEQRVLNEVEFLSLEGGAADHHIAVVTHAGVLRTVLCALHGCSEDSVREQTRSYCSVIRHTTVTSSSVPTAEVAF
jgi:alpha-ribazole phosphatase/probable phosphoglycerate mutase